MRFTPTAKLFLASGAIIATAAGASPAATVQVRVQETVAIFPSLEPDFAPLPGFAMLSRRTSAGWGATRVRATSALGRLGISHETTVCGPSLAVNTLTCHSLPTSRFLADLPIPGFLSTHPVYFEDSWLVATTKGFLVRMRRSALQTNAQPATRPEHFSFWGAESRKAMGSLKSTGQWNGDAFLWSYSLGSEIVGSPVIFEKNYYAVATNQYLYAIDVATGQPKWTLRLAPDTALRLEATPLTTIPSEGQILVGTSEGTLVAVSAQNGSLAWRHRLETTPGQRFAGIAAKPLVLEKSIVVSSAEGITERISFERCSTGSAHCTGDNRAVEWRYNVGSIAEPRRFDNGIAIGGQNGTVALLESRSGAVRWKANVFSGGVIASMDAVFLAGNEYLVVASTEGAIAVLSNVGKVLSTTAPVGEVTGEFFAGHEASEVCLSFVTPGLRCFRLFL
jgi:hypothetical protein